MYVRNVQNNFIASALKASHTYTLSRIEVCAVKFHRRRRGFFDKFLHRRKFSSMRGRVARPSIGNDRRQIFKCRKHYFKYELLQLKILLKIK